jgi:L-alanine-DL-glutamate epimerase-like enolase superfamily enzyme
LGFDLQLLHDVHERLAPIDAIGLAKALEPHKLFFLEDPLAPEDLEWMHMLRAQTSTPIAFGQNDWGSKSFKLSIYFRPVIFKSNVPGFL